MSIRKCPHLVRHGTVAKDGKTIEFRNMCGLVLKKVDASGNARKIPKFDEECDKVPFTKGFDYMCCHVYQEIFKTKGIRNNVNPTSDITYNALSSSTFTDMELL